MEIIESHHELTILNFEFQEVCANGNQKERTGKSKPSSATDVAITRKSLSSVIGYRFS